MAHTPNVCSVSRFSCCFRTLLDIERTAFCLRVKAQRLLLRPELESSQTESSKLVTNSPQRLALLADDRTVAG